MRKQRFSPSLPRRLPLAGAVITALMGLQAQHAGAQALAAGALPTNGQVVLGTGSISQNGTAMQVLQSSGKLITNWDSFNIGSGARVDFMQPSSSSMALNRVLSADPSRIYGQLNANGQVFLINPSGVLFAPGSRVNVGGLVASTLDISNADFAAGNFRFGKGSLATGEVVNEGEITTADKGYAALLGPRVRNDGSIVARMGTVALAAGDAVTLDLHGDSLINLQIDSAAAQALATNSGAIRADGGLVILAASSSGDALSTVLNNTGTVHSTSLANVNGVIRLEGGANGVVSLSGTLDASGKGAGQTGGTVKVLGDKVGLFDGARVDVSGDVGGGTALVGGNWQGSGTEQRASAAYVAADAKINADAITSGNGGKVVVWADGSTRFEGAISARGGAAGGDGGAAEVSGKQFLDFNGLAVLTAAQGSTGSLLLDPTNITISTGTNAATYTAGTNTFTGAGATSILNTTTLVNQLNNSNVTVSTASAGASLGDITVANNIAYTGAATRTLTLQANQDINLSAGSTISSSTGALNVVLNSGAAGGVGSVSLSGAAQVITNGGDITIGGGVGALGAATGGGTASQNGFRMLGGGTSEATGALLNAGGGNITIRAAGGTASGFSMVASASTGFDSIITSGAGTINITSTATGSSNGVNVTTGTNTIRTGGGALNINGTSSGSGTGILIANAGTNSVLTNNGAITLTGSSGTGNGISLAASTGAIRVEATGAGNVTLSGNSLVLAPTGVGTTTIKSAGGALVLQPLSDAASIGIAGAAGDFALSTANLATLVDGFSSITIGRATGTGAINVNAATFTDNLTLRQASGGVAFGGALNMGSNSLSIVSGGGAISGVRAAAGNITINGAGAVGFGNTSATGALAVSTNGAVTQSAGSSVVVAGATSLAAGAGNDITLAEAGNNFSTVAITSGRNVSLRDSGALAMAASSVSGQLDLRAGGAITQTGALNVAGGLSLTTDQVAGDVTLSNAGGSGTTLGDVRVGNNFSLTSNGDIAQAGGTTLVIGNNFTVSGGTLPAPAAGNVIGGTDNSAGSGTVIKQVGVVDLSTINIGGAGDEGKIIVGGNLSVQSLASADTIAAKVGAGTTAINLSNAGNSIGGAISITASAPTVTPSGAAQATGIQQNGATIAVGGNASFSAATSSANAGGKAGNITLDGAGNQFSGAVSFSGNDVLINSANALALGASSASGVLTLRAMAGNISSAAALTVGGDASFTADGGGRSITLDNAANNFGGAVGFGGTGGLANVSITDTTALDLQALTLSGNLAVKASSITDSGVLSVGGTTALQSTGNVTLDNAGHSFTGAVSVAAAGADIRSGGALLMGTSSITGDLALTANGAITQSGALAVTGNLTLATTHAAGDVTLDNTGAATTKLGNQSVGGNLVVTATGKNVTQNAGSNINVAGDFSINATGISTNPADNLIGGTDNTLGGGTFIKKVGVVALDNIDIAGNLTVISLATGQVFDGAAVHGTAVNLANAANNIGGTVTISTSGPAVISTGAAQPTGITQNAGTTVKVGGASNFAASNGDVTLANTGNTFGGAVSASGNNITLRGNGALVLGGISAAGQLLVNATAGISQTAAGVSATGNSTLDAGAGALILNTAGNDFGGTVALANTSGAVSLTDTNALSLGAVNAAGALTLTAGGMTTLNNNLSGAGVTFNGAGAGAVTLANDVSIDGRTGTITMGAMTGGTRNLTLTSDNIALNGNWSGTGAYTLQTASDATTIGLAGGAGSYALTATEMANIAAASSSQVTIGRATGTGTMTVGAVNFDDKLALRGGAVTFTSGSQTFGNGLAVTGSGRVQLNGATVTATGGDIVINGTGSGASQGFSMLGGATLQTSAGNISITAANATGTAFSMAGGANTIQAAGTGNVTIDANATGASGFGVSMGTSGTNTVRVANGALGVTAKSAGSDSALSMGSGSNLFEATGSGSITASGTATGGGSGVSLATSGTNGMKTASGSLSVTGSATGAGAGISIGSGAHTLASSSGNVILDGSANGTGNGVTFTTGINTVEAGGGGNVTITARSLGASGFGMSMGGSGTGTVRVADGTLAINAASVGTDTALSIGSGTNTLRATGAGNISIAADAQGMGGNGLSIGSAGTNTISTVAGDVAINASSAAGSGIAIGSGTSAITTGGGDISIQAKALGSGAGLSLASGANIVAAGGAGDLIINASSGTGNGLSLGTAGSTANSSTLRVTDGTLALNVTAGGSTSALSLGVGSGATGPATNLIEATLGGSIEITASNTGTGNAMSMGTSSNNTVRAGTGNVTVTGTSAQAVGISLASGNNTITAGGGVTLNGTSQGDGNGVSMATGTNLVAALGTGNLTVNAVSRGATEGFGLSMGTSGNNALRVQDGVLAVNAQSAGSGSAITMGSGTNTMEALGAGRIALAGNATGSGNGVSMGTGGTNTVRTVSGGLDVSGTGNGAGHGITMGSGVNTLQADSGAVNLSGKALGTGNGFYITTTGRDSVLTRTGDITITGTSASGDAIAIRPTADVATIESTGAGNVSFRADNYDATPSGTGSVRVASNGGVLSIVQITPGTSIGIGDGASGALNWSGAEVQQVSGFRQVRIGNSESGALDLRPPWFPFAMVLPPASLTADEQKLEAIKAAVESLVSNMMLIGELPPTLQVTPRFRLLVQGFDK